MAQQVSSPLHAYICYEVVQWFGLLQCTRLAYLTASSANFIAQRGAEIKAVSVVFVKCPGRGGQIELASDIIGAFRGGGYPVGDRNERDVQLVNVRRDARTRQFLSHNQALYTFVTTGTVCAIPFIGLQLFNNVRGLVQGAIGNRVVHILNVNERSQWGATNYVAGQAVVFAVEAPGQAVAASDFVRINGGFTL